jgi:hypothetical protein
MKGRGEAVSQYELASDASGFIHAPRRRFVSEKNRGNGQSQSGRDNDE